MKAIPSELPLRKRSNFNNVKDEHVDKLPIPL
eukprot:SAG31_NODE_42531_length_271_cov_0.604651_1_plen_31_part_01